MKQNKFSQATAGALLALTCFFSTASAADASPERIGVLVQQALRGAKKDAPADVSVRIAGSDESLVPAGDPAAVRRALRNVFAYSARAMAHRPNRFVEVRVDRNGENVDVVIRDSGPGVGAEDLLAIYGYTLTGVQDATRDLLAQANRLALSLGGHLLIDSQEGAGTEYVVELPISKSGDDAIAAR